MFILYRLLITARPTLAEPLLRNYISVISVEISTEQRDKESCQNEKHHSAALSVVPLALP